jgi:hypothetical protein
MRSTALAVCALMVMAASALADSLDLEVRPIETFGSSVGPDKPLEFLGGLDVTASTNVFGGLSGIDMIEGDKVLFISDSSTYVTARLVHEGGRLVGLADTEIGSLFPDGDMSKTSGDAEDVALDPNDRSRGVIVRERQANAMLAFDLAGGRPENFEPKFVGVPDRVLRSNSGLESVAYAPASSSLAGEIITIGERPLRGETDLTGWVAGKGSFSIVRRDKYDVSSARFLPNGDLILLERRYAPAWGIAMRLRRIAGDTIRIGARIDGDILLDAGMTSQIDNMEGLAVSQDEAGRTILTVVSDDNFSILQRTLILQFALNEELVN